MIGLACHRHSEALMQRWYEANRTASRRPFVLPWRTWLMYHTWLSPLFMRQHRDG